MEKMTRTNHHANIVQAQGSTEVATPAKKTTKRSMLCFVLFVLLGFSLGCSEFVVIGIEPELAENYRCSIARIGELISLFCARLRYRDPAALDLHRIVSALDHSGGLPCDLRGEQLRFRHRTHL